MSDPTQNQVTDQPVTPADTLRDAALYLMLHGWAKGHRFAHLGAMPQTDVEGAIRMAVIGRPDPRPWYALPDEHLDLIIPALCQLVGYLVASGIVTGVDPSCDKARHLIAEWNDGQSTVIGQVLAAMYSAAEGWDMCNGGGVQ